MMGKAWTRQGSMAIVAPIRATAHIELARRDVTPGAMGMIVSSLYRSIPQRAIEV